MWKQLLKLLRTEPLKTARPKNTPVLKNLRSEWIRGLQTAQKTTPQEKSWVEAGPGKEHEKVALRRQKGALSHVTYTGRKNRRVGWKTAQEKWLKKVALRREKDALQHPKQKRTWNNNWVKKGEKKKKKEVKKHSNANEPYKC